MRLQRPIYLFFFSLTCSAQNQSNFSCSFLGHGDWAVASPSTWKKIEGERGQLHGRKGSPFIKSWTDTQQPPGEHSRLQALPCLAVSRLPSALGGWPGNFFTVLLMLNLKNIVVPHQFLVFSSSSSSRVSELPGLLTFLKSLLLLRGSFPSMLLLV